MTQLKDNNSVVVLFENYFQNIKEYISTINYDRILDLLNLLVKSHRNNRIFIMGNGGSISTAAHFSNDLTSISPGFMTICLNDVNSMSCIANDRGYELVFYEQLISLASADDVVIMLSASGSSENLLKAVEASKYKLAKTVAIVGFDGGLLKDKVDVCIHIESSLGDYRAVEDCHSIICHFIVDFIDKLSKNRAVVKAGFKRGVNPFEDFERLILFK